MNLSKQDTHLLPSIPYGYCHCGCGEKTNLASQTNPRDGWIKGEPIRYIQGHHLRIKRAPLDKEPFLYEGHLCRRLPLDARGKFVLVDESDYGKLAQWTWSSLGPKNGPYYAARRDYVTKKIVKMHRILMNAPEGIEVDHKNNNTLDNRRSNLRFADRSQNAANRRASLVSKSGYKGVTRTRNGGKWRARITYKRTCIWLGLFDCVEDAAAAYRKKALELFEEFAKY